MAEAPEWLLALVTEPEQEPAAPSEQAVEEIPEGARNETLFRLGRSLRAKGLTEQGVLAALREENAARCRPPLEDKEVAQIASSACSKSPGQSPGYQPRGREPPRGPLGVVAGTDTEEAESIRVIDGFLPQATDQAEAALLRLGTDVFQHGARLVRIGQWEDLPGSVTRPQASAVLIEITPPWLVDKLTRAVRWERYDKRNEEYRRIDCPRKVADTLLAREGQWRFQRLLGFIESPTLDLSGRPITTRGYDAPSGLYLTHAAHLPPVEPLARGPLRAALARLRELVATFPFLEPCDEAAAVALMATAVFRRLLPASPLGAISATTPATGKSLLANVIATIATGRDASAMSVGASPEELEKRIDTVLLTSDPVVLVDNVDRAIKSDVLCQVATQARKSVRVLGQSKIIEAPTNVCFLFTGNNLTLLGDLVRRIVLVRLDAGCERPEQRVFERDAVMYAAEQRPRVLHDILSITRSYIDAGAPALGATPYGSFAAWDRMVRFPLIWAGLPDPLASAEEMRDADHEVMAVRQLITAWKERYPIPVTAAEVVSDARASVQQLDGRFAPANPALADAVTALIGEKGGARDLGYRLRAYAGRIFGHEHFERAPKTKAGVAWTVKETGK